MDGLAELGRCRRRGHPASDLWRTVPEGPREGCSLQAPEITGCGSPHETEPQTAAEGSLEACLRLSKLCPQQRAGAQPQSPLSAPEQGWLRAGLKSALS